MTLSIPELPLVYLSDDELALINLLRADMLRDRYALLLRDAYFNGEQLVRDLGISIPPQLKGLHTVIVHIPYGLFRFLLKLYALFSRKPPFTADQLKALTAGDDFKGVDTQAVFGVTQTPFENAVRESYCDKRYSGIVLRR